MLGILAGYQMAFDVGSSKLTKSNFAVGYSAGNLTFHTCVNNGSEVAGSLHQKHSDKLETALNASYARYENTISLFHLDVREVWDCVSF